MIEWKRINIRGRDERWDGGTASGDGNIYKTILLTIEGNRERLCGERDGGKHQQGKMSQEVLWVWNI
jgi:hypothetical protein